MKMTRTKDWWLARAQREGDAAIGVGLLARDPVIESSGERGDRRPSAVLVANEGRVAFSRFVRLMRRQRGLSIEKFAEEASLDVGEVVCIEDDPHYRPDPRTIFQLAQTFNVKQHYLMQLSGLAVANDTGLQREAVRFAARSESLQKLTTEEKEALDDFVAALSNNYEAQDSR
jgi:HTH-type transcriptional regulator, competence development regulator